MQSHARRHLLPLATSSRPGFELSAKPSRDRDSSYGGCRRCASPFAASSRLHVPLTASSFRTGPPYSFCSCRALLWPGPDQANPMQDMMRARIPQFIVFVWMPLRMACVHAETFGVLATGSRNSTTSTILGPDGPPSQHCVTYFGRSGGDGPLFGAYATTSSCLWAHLCQSMPRTSPDLPVARTRK